MSTKILLSMNKNKSQTTANQTQSPTDYSDLQYELEFQSLLESNQLLQKSDQLQKSTEAEISDLCSRMKVIVYDWTKQSKEIKEIYYPENLLRGILFMLNHKNLRIRIKVAKTILQILKQLKWWEYFGAVKEESHDIQGMQLNEEEIYQILFCSLKPCLELSDDEQNDAIFISQTYPQSLLELLQQFTQLDPEKLITQGFLELLLLLYTILKNNSVNQNIRKFIVENKNIMAIIYFMHYYELKPGNDNNPLILKIYEAITGLLRNLAIQSESSKKFLQLKVVDLLTRSIELYPKEFTLMYNTLRVLTKLSLSKDCCLHLYQNKNCLKNFMQFFKQFKTDLNIIIRISFILANMTTFFVEIRELIYFQFQGFKDIYLSFDLYFNNDLKPQKITNIDKLGVSQATWDFDANKTKETDADVIIKLIRLLANLLTVEKIGMDFVQKQQFYLKDILKKAKLLLLNKSMEKHSELVTCCLSWLANLIYYEKQAVIVKDPEISKLQAEILMILPNHIIQAQNTEICNEALRVLANLSRNKALLKNIKKLSLIDGVLLLLNHTSKDIVYNSLGIIINCFSDQEIKKQYGKPCAQQILQVIKDCTIDDYDLIYLALQCISNIFENYSQELSEGQLKELEEMLVKLGDESDIVIEYEKSQNCENEEISQLRKLLNQVLNNMPELGFFCPVDKCGRKFKSQGEMDKHIERRHK